MVVSFSSVNLAESAVTNSYVWTTLQADAQRTGFTESPAPNSNQTFWKFQTGGPITSSPAVAAGMVFVGSADGYLYAVNATTGTKMWASWVGTDINSPTLANDKQHYSFNFLLPKLNTKLFAFFVTLSLPYNQILS